MRIKKPRHTTVELRQSRDDLMELLRRPAQCAGRPCSSCVIPCEQHKSPTCDCDCSPACPDAPAELSSEPERFPIEPGIVPLAFELARANGIDPFWSCEGHLTQSGAMLRLPSVSFSVQSTVLARLIAHYLSELLIAKLISNPWQLRIVEWGDVTAPAYSIEPHLQPETGISLTAVRQDARVIADRLSNGIKRAAQEYIFALDRAIAQGDNGPSTQSNWDQPARRIAN